ncbi:MAG: TIR domain-containing protein [Parvularculaceae bacterium]
MPDIFISYSRVDRLRIETLARALEDQGFDVWWDRNLEAGTVFAKETEERLLAAKIILVAWSAASIGSMWVADEASVGREKGNLLPISLDDIPPPLGFRQIQTLPFSDWAGASDSAEFSELMKALRSPGARRSAAPAGDAPKKSDDKSVAVLPFANMSSDPEQAYFSDGVAEEIIIALMKVDGLRVAGRTSSFSFKGKDLNVKAIGEQLGVAFILDGSVRKAGKRVRISVQLVSARDGFHVWSESFDRTLDDLFDVQDEIARAVVDALKVKLAAPSQRLVAANATSEEAYQLFLQGRHLVRQRYGQNGGAALLKGVDFLKRAVEIDPQFARGHSLLALAYIWMPQYVEISGDEAFATAKLYCETASRLDPELSDHIAGISVLNLYARNYQLSFEAAERALALAPKDGTSLRIVGGAWILYGYPERGLHYLEEAIRIDPTSGMEAAWRAEGAFAVSDFATAREYSKLAINLGCNFGGRVLAELVARDGDSEAASKLFAAAILGERSAGNIDAARLCTLVFGDDNARAHANRELTAMLDGETPRGARALIVMLLIKLGRYDEAIDLFLPGPTNHEDAVLLEFWLPQHDAFRKSDAFKRYARATGLIDLWSARGWPDSVPAFG